MSARRVVGVLVFALACYFLLIGYRGIYLLTRTAWDLKLFGVAVLVLPLVGIWVVWAEIRFGAATARLAARLRADEVSGPAVADRALEELPRRPSGRVDRDAADALFARRRAEVEAAPGQWQGWYRLAEAYDVAGDRRRARGAMREAIALAEPAQPS